MARLVDALAAIRSARFDLPLTYDAGTLPLHVGDVVEVPLGRREVLAYVVRAPYEGAARPGLRPVRARVDVPRAFDETGLHLARFVADAYLCTLGEALGAIVRAEALPRIRDLLVRVAPRPHPERFASVPPPLLDVLWAEPDDEIPVERLLRHPAARRAADRPTLLRSIATLVRGGVLRRERRMSGARAHAYRIRVLRCAGDPPRGPKARALYDLVAQRQTLPRSEALLAGFSHAVIARSVRTGALEEEERAPQRTRRARAPLAQPSDAQRAAIERIENDVRAGAFSPILLHGVTGSGKTLVYLHAVSAVVRAGGRAIVLVPEISLTPQTAARFEAVFGERVAVLHSALSDTERIDAWQACARGDIDVVVGARSAVFAPLPGVRLLVVDESHEGSYKQDAVPRYHAVAVARERMRVAGGVLVLGSATPSLESYAAARAGRIALVELPQRVGAPLPDVRVVDLTTEFAGGRRGLFSVALTQALVERLERGEKSVLFVNRRGSARFLLCRACGAVPECPRCSVSLAAHRGEGLLRCHSCDYRERLWQRCKRCGGDALGELGPGTERVAEEVRRLWPRARVLRMDSDTTTHVGDHARLLREFEEEGDVLVGTQMVAKGLDFARVTLAGVVAADVGLHVPDFRAAERTFDLVTQVCGRSGRASPGLAIVQTYDPQHPAIRFAAMHDYEAFAERELAERTALGYPPATRLVYLGVIGRNRSLVSGVAERYARELRALDVAVVLGPAPYPIARVNEEWRYRISLRTRRPATLRQALRERILPLARRDRTTRLAVNVDP